MSYIFTSDVKDVHCCLSQSVLHLITGDLNALSRCSLVRGEVQDQTMEQYCRTFKTCPRNQWFPENPASFFLESWVFVTRQVHGHGGTHVRVKSKQNPIDRGWIWLSNGNTVGYRIEVLVMVNNSDLQPLCFGFHEAHSRSPFWFYLKNWLNKVLK